MDGRDTANGGSGSMFPALVILIVLTMDIAAILILLVIAVAIYLHKRRSKPDEGEDNSPPNNVANVTLEIKER